MGSRFPEIGIITDVIANPIFVEVCVKLWPPREPFNDFERLQDGTTVGFASAKVVNLAGTRSANEGFDEPGNVVAVNVIADLLPLVAVDPIFAAFHVTLHQIAQKTVKLDTAVVRAGEAASAQAAGRHPKISAILLDHDVGGDFGGTKKAVLGLVDGEGFRNPLLVSGIIVVPPGGKFLQSDVIGAVTIDFVGGHVDERRLGADLPGCFEKVKGPDGVGVEIVKRDGGGPVVTRLCGSMNDCIGAYRTEQLSDTTAIPDIQFVMFEVREGDLEALLAPTRVPLRAEEYRALIVVHTMNPPAALVKISANLGANQP